MRSEATPLCFGIAQALSGTPAKASPRPSQLAPRRPQSPCRTIRLTSHAKLRTSRASLRTPRQLRIPSHPVLASPRTLKITSRAALGASRAILSASRTGLRIPRAHSTPARDTSPQPRTRKSRISPKNREKHPSKTHRFPRANRFKPTFFKKSHPRTPIPGTPTCYNLAHTNPPSLTSDIRPLTSSPP
jgi:hypothetical protein